MRYSTTLPDSLPWPADLPCAIDLPRLMQALTTVTDQRAPRGVRYPLAPMLAIAMLAKLCGYSQLEALADWAQHRAAGLVALFQLRRPTMPHARTWGRIMATAVDPSALTGALAHAFTAIDPYHVPLRGERLLILDGKTKPCAARFPLVTRRACTLLRCLSQQRVSSMPNRLSRAKPMKSPWLPRSWPPVPWMAQW